MRVSACMIALLADSGDEELSLIKRPGQKQAHIIAPVVCEARGSPSFLCSSGNKARGMERRKAREHPDALRRRVPCDRDAAFRRSTCGHLTDGCAAFGFPVLSSGPRFRETAKCAGPSSELLAAHP